MVIYGTQISLGGGGESAFIGIVNILNDQYNILI